MTTTTRFTSADLQVLPQDNKRYEIIGGELFVSRMPHNFHQHVCTSISYLLEGWSRAGGGGRVLSAPGVVFAEDDDVVPDVAWVSEEVWHRAFDAAGHFTVAPELVVEVLSPGPENERRDRDAKLKLYSRRGVKEYWIVDWQVRCVDIFRQKDGSLELVERLIGGTITSPNFPGLASSLAELFRGLP